MVERSLYRKNMVLGSYSLVRKWYFKLDMWYLFSSKYIVVLVPRIWFHPLVNHMMLVTTYLRVRNWYFHLTNLVIIHWKTWWSWYRVFDTFSWAKIWYFVIVHWEELGAPCFCTAPITVPCLKNFSQNFGTSTELSGN